MLKKILAAHGHAVCGRLLGGRRCQQGNGRRTRRPQGRRPRLSKRIIDARKQGEFKDWPDFMSRVKGVKDKSAAKLSAEGLTVNGQAFPHAAPNDAGEGGGAEEGRQQQPRKSRSRSKR